MWKYFAGGSGGSPATTDDGGFWEYARGPITAADLDAVIGDPATYGVRTPCRSVAAVWDFFASLAQDLESSDPALWAFTKWDEPLPREAAEVFTAATIRLRWHCTHLLAL